MSGETNIIHYFIIGTFILIFGVLAVSIYGMHSTYFTAEVVSHEFNYDDGIYVIVVYSNETAPATIGIPANGRLEEYPVGSCAIIVKTTYWGKFPQFNIYGACP